MISKELLSEVINIKIEDIKGVKMFGDNIDFISIEKYNEVVTELNQLRNIKKENERLEVEISILKTKVEQLTEYKILAETTFKTLSKEGN